MSSINLRLFYIVSFKIIIFVNFVSQPEGEWMLNVNYVF